jgi:hypothetical protein
MQGWFCASTQRPASSWGAGATPAPPEAAIDVATPAGMQQNRSAAKRGYVMARAGLPARQRAASLTGGGNSPLFLRPTELADGLALKELRYRREFVSHDYLARIRPRGGSTPCRPFGSPVPRSSPRDRPGIRQAYLKAASLAAFAVA